MLIPPPLSLYIHFPWCIKKCPYCDFNSHELKTPLQQEAYIDALMADLEQDLPSVWGRPVTAVFMGGGTPSLFSGEMMQRLMSRIRALLTLQPDAEITMEANPGSQEFDDLQRYQAAGINRLSFGIQSLDDAQLKQLGRIHNSAEAKHAVSMARKAGFENFNVDMMFGLPGQSLAAAKEDLEQLIALESSHISYYQLTIEANTMFAVNTPKNLPSDGMLHDAFLQGESLLNDAGFEHYEVSAYARPGRHSRHNMNYWQFGDYLGIGAGAHSKITMGHSGEIWRAVKQKHPIQYMNKAATEKRLMSHQQVDDKTLLFEYFLNHLRIKKPIKWSHFESVSGLPASRAQEALEPLVDAGLLFFTGDSMTLTDQGFLLSDEILKQLL